VYYAITVTDDIKKHNTKEKTNTIFDYIYHHYLSELYTYLFN
jgi:hypothetical protein